MLQNGPNPVLLNIKVSRSVVATKFFGENASIVNFNLKYVQPKYIGLTENDIILNKLSDTLHY